MSKRKSIITFATSKLLSKGAESKSFIESITTIHGLSHFVNLGAKSKIVWLFLVLCNVAGIIAFLIIIQKRFYNDQIVTKIYSDWTVEKVPFPSVSICNLNDVSRRESKTIEKILQKFDISQSEIDSFFRDLPSLIFFGLGSANISNHSEIMKVLKAHYYSIDTIMEEIHQKCEDLLVYCEFDSKDKSCKDLFKLTPTSSGFCCSFNFGGLNNDEDIRIMDGDDDFEYYYDQGMDEASKTSLIATSQSGRKSGLRVVFDVEPNDYGEYSLTAAFGAKILINDPNDYIETRFSYKYMTIGQTVTMKVEPLIFQSEDSLRDMDPARRGCWFYDEVELMNTNRYSYETCHTECRIASYLHFCGCVPYKYPDKMHRTCEFTDLQCLYYMKVNWDRVRLQCQPTCLRECRDKEYYLTTDNMPFLAVSYPDKVTNGRNISELAGLHVYYIRSTCNCYKMILLMDSNTFIATYGGIFSITFGASVITLFELTYLSLASLVKVIRRFSFGKKTTKMQKKF